MRGPGRENRAAGGWPSEVGASASSGTCSGGSSSSSAAGTRAGRLWTAGTRLGLVCGLAATTALAAGCDVEDHVGAVQPAPGSLRVLDAGGPHGDVGWWPSAVFDSHDQPHISYCDAANGDLKYATRIGRHWKVTTALHKGAVGKYTAIAVDSHDRPAIAYYNQDTKYLCYAHLAADGTWHTENVAWGLEIGMASQLRFDAHDHAQLFYYVPDGKLAHAERLAPGKWRKEEVAKATGGFSVGISVVHRPRGYWLSFIDWTFKDTTLKLAEPKPGGGWSFDTVATRHGPGWHSQLIFQHGKPLVFYSQNIGQQLRVAHKSKGAWKPEIVIRESGNFAAARRPDGRIIIAYEDISHGAVGNGTLKYLLGEGRNWQRFSVDPEGPSGTYMALALDSRGRPLIAYYAKNIHGLKVYDETLPPPSGNEVSAKKTSVKKTSAKRLAAKKLSAKAK